MLSEAYQYYDVGSDKTTTQVSSFSSAHGDTTLLEQDFTYDLNGNILSVSGTNTETYTYDNQDQLTDATVNGTTYSYSYNTYGNILSASDGTVTKEFTYSTGAWKDQLTAVKVDNGTTVNLTYDAIGNPLSYYNGRSYTFSWSEGRRLSEVSVDSANYSYAYDADGLRTSKSTSNGTSSKKNAKIEEQVL